jgi:preprotein translocase subunit SecF
MRYRWLYFVISALVILPGIYCLLRFGLKPGIDFTGGSLIELQANTDLSALRPVIETLVPVANLQQSSGNTFILRTKQLNEAEAQQLLQQLSGRFGEVKEVRFETVGPLLGRELVQKTLIGVIISAGFILLYVAYRFKNKKYGICAVLAMLHDSLVMLGVFSFLGAVKGVEVDALFVTAILTILSFSVHDTIVVYDRIRESTRLFSKLNYEELVDKALNETMGRSIKNSLTIIFMLLALYLLGGSTTKWFVFALLIGTVSGTYSSPFTAAPLLIIWDHLVSKRRDSRG